MSESGEDTVLRRGSAIAIGALSSRITGFVRTAALGAALGAGLAGDAYATATMLPGIIYEILLGGIGTAILVPLLNKARGRGSPQSEVFAQRLLSVAVIGFAIATVLATASIPLVIPVLGGPGDNTRLTIALALFTVPAVFFYGVGAVATAVLNARGRFALPAWAPALYNLTLIAASVLLLLVPAPASGFGAGRTLLLGAATLIGAAAQTVVLFPALARSGVRWAWRPQLRGLGLRPLARTLAWITGYMIIGQSAVLVTIALTRAAAGNGGPGPFIYNNAWILLMMAYGLLALPIITAITPALSSTIGADTAEATSRAYRGGVGLITQITAPATAVMIVLADPIAIALFEWGNYTHDQALATGTVIACAATGLTFYSLAQLQLFTFLAIDDARTPTLITTAVNGIRIAASVAAYLLVPADHAAAAIMVTGTIGYALTVGITGPRLRSRLRQPSSLPPRHTIIVLTAGMVSAVAGWGITSGIEAVLGGTKLAAFTTLIIAIPVMLTLYLTTSHLLGRRELTGPILERLPAIRRPRAHSRP